MEGWEGEQVLPWIRSLPRYQRTATEGHCQEKSSRCLSRSGPSEAGPLRLTSALNFFIFALSSPRLVLLGSGETCLRGRASACLGVKAATDSFRVVDYTSGDACSVDPAPIAVAGTRPLLATRTLEWPTLDSYRRITSHPAISHQSLRNRSPSSRKPSLIRGLAVRRLDS